MIAVELDALHQPVCHGPSAFPNFRLLTMSRGHLERWMAAVDRQRWIFVSEGHGAVGGGDRRWLRCHAMKDMSSSFELLSSTLTL